MELGEDPGRRPTRINLVGGGCCCWNGERRLLLLTRFDDFPLSIGTRTVFMFSFFPFKVGTPQQENSQIRE
jgi:hypothetical protein